MTPEMSVLLWILSVLLVLVGIAGTILPALPGTPLVLIGLILAAWADGFRKSLAGCRGGSRRGDRGTRGLEPFSACR